MDNAALIQEVTAKANVWLNGNYDAETKEGVKKLLENPDKTDLIEAFYRDLEFGTGGLRGIMGVGTNRMNRYTVGSATQGLANYLKKQFPGQQIKVVVGHDCRNNSRFFAETTADVLSANGIKVYLFDALRPTPEVSFAIRELGCQSGVNITASHNPKEYNGYKAYWNDGAQFVAPHDTAVIDEVLAIKSIDDVKFQGNKELIEIIGKEIDEKYKKLICGLSLSPEAIKKNADMKIVYTPIHGTGIMLIPDTLKQFGFKNIISVDEQNVISGDFPTVVSPNPEEQAAMNMAIEKAKEVDADLVMASDPDADRVGSAIKNAKGEWMLVNGNQMGMILTYYLLRRWKELGKLKGKEFVVKTIVTTELIKTIADKYNTPCYDVYTGFKWIADIIKKLEGKAQYIGGGEESYGYLPQDFVRDKDAVSTCSMLAEVAAWAKDNGMSMYDLLCKIYAEFGFSLNKGISVVKKGKSGAEEIKAMMENYRKNAPKDLGGSKVVLVKDYANLTATAADGKVEKLEMPTTSNVLQYFTEDGSKVSIRPSGTEPKIKFYIEVLGEMKSVEDYDKAMAAATAKIEAFKVSLGL